MMKYFVKVAVGTWLVMLLATPYSLANGIEERSMVANGQGISSPSFWGGISGQNPAGLLNNLDFKLQGTAASFDDSTSNLRESGGFFLGNGVVAAGAEYSNYNSGPYARGYYQINWGLGTRVEATRTSLAVSGHQVSVGGGVSSYDLGMIMELSSQTRFGAMITDFTRGLRVIGGGFTYISDPMVDFVVDAGYHLVAKYGVIKPGISFHTYSIQATASYGFRFTGIVDSVIVNTKFTAGIGLKLAEKIFLEYEYRELPEHRLGLTLRFN